MQTISNFHFQFSKIFPKPFLFTISMQCLFKDKIIKELVCSFYAVFMQWVCSFHATSEVLHSHYIPNYLSISFHNTVLQKTPQTTYFFSFKKSKI